MSRFTYIYSEFFFVFVISNWKLVIENLLFLTQVLQLITPIAQYVNNWYC